MASAHVAAVPHGGRRKVKGALYMRLSKSREGNKIDPSLSMPKSEGSDNLQISNIQKFFQFCQGASLLLMYCDLGNAIHIRNSSFG